MKLNNLVIIGVAATTVASCAPSKKEYASYELYPVRTGSLAEMEYAPAATQFTLWSPTADEVRLMLYDAGEGGHAYETVAMSPAEDGTWTAKVEQDLKGKFYTFNVKINGKWLGDTPGINAQAVGVNGKRAAVIDMRETDPEGWAEDKRPPLASPADVIIYEVHHRDFSIDPSSGIRNKGKFLAMTEPGTVNPDKLATGIDHLKELGVTHVHILPSYDYASVDESRLDENKYNWGYDPQNYNVPDGSYATDPYKPDVRIREFKQMVQALHKAGIRVAGRGVQSHFQYGREQFRAYRSRIFLSSGSRRRFCRCLCMRQRNGEQPPYDAQIYGRVRIALDKRIPYRRFPFRLNGHSRHRNHERNTQGGNSGRPYHLYLWRGMGRIGSPIGAGLLGDESQYL